MNAKYNETRFQVPQDSSSSESTSFTEFARALSRSACFQKRVSFLSLSLSVLKKTQTQHSFSQRATPWNPRYRILFQINSLSPSRESVIIRLTRPACTAGQAAVP